MIHYTPLSEMDIYPISDSDYSSRKCITYDGKTIYVEQNANGEYQLIQLLSTDPQDYLNDKYSPGTIIS